MTPPRSGSCGDAVGTDRGYQRHRAAREEACEECSTAHRDSVNYYGRLRRERGLPPDDPMHSTVAGYSAGCREQCCRKAMADRKAGRPYVRKPTKRPGPILHGDMRGYWAGCRCLACRTAQTIYRRERYERERDDP